MGDEKGEQGLKADHNTEWSEGLEGRDRLAERLSLFIPTLFVDSLRVAKCLVI